VRREWTNVSGMLSSSNNLTALQGQWADTESYRGDQITLMTSAGGQVPVTLALADRLGRRLGGSLDPEGGAHEIPGADIIEFGTADSVEGQFAVVTKADA